MEIFGFEVQLYAEKVMRLFMFKLLIYLEKFNGHVYTIYGVISNVKPGNMQGCTLR